VLPNKEGILKHPRLCQSIFGMRKEEIERLLPIFSQCLIVYQHQLKPKRKRKVGGGRKGDLPTDEDKLLYILMYLKIYPTYDVLAVMTSHQRSKCGDFSPVSPASAGNGFGTGIGFAKKKSSFTGRSF
jgi:hypothetical protein